MTAVKHRVIQAGFSAFALSRLHRLVAPVTRGRGAILTFHHVKPGTDAAFAPNRLLAITPGFLDRLLHRLKASGYGILPLDAVPDALAAHDRPFVALTFDDGYRDNLTEALPVLERHAAPFTLFATTGFLDRTARLWWIELEEALRRLPAVALGPDGPRMEADTPARKSRAFRTLSRSLARRSDAERLAAVAAIGSAVGIDPSAIVARLCLDWDQLATLAAHPLATIGCHTLSHPRLSTLSRLAALREIGEARARLEAELKRPVRHLAYPYGTPDAAGAREFEIARELGFASAVTTRPGTLFPSHRDHLFALPRISMNGLWQTTQVADMLLSGAPLALWNRGRRLNVA